MVHHRFSSTTLVKPPARHYEMKSSLEIPSTPTHMMGRLFSDLCEISSFITCMIPLLIVLTNYSYRRVPLEEIPTETDEACAMWLHKFFQEKVCFFPGQSATIHPLRFASLLQCSQFSRHGLFSKYFRPQN